MRRELERPCNYPKVPRTKNAHAEQDLCDKIEGYRHRATEGICDPLILSLVKNSPG